jgi:hypothetical protein
MHGVTVYNGMFNNKKASETEALIAIQKDIELHK